MKKKITRSIFALLALFAVSASFMSATGASRSADIPCISDTYADVAEDHYESFHVPSSAEPSPFRRGDAELDLLGIPTAASGRSADLKDLNLYVGGMPFGVKFATEGLLVVGFSDIKNGSKTENPCKDSGIKIGDTIISINGKKLTDAEELGDVVAKNGDKEMKIGYIRNGKSYTATIRPAYCAEEGKYKAGVFLRDSGAGIGTVTFIDPRDNSFGGLGHGICDADTGGLIPIGRGSVVDVSITGVVKGLVGSPGEVKGCFTSGKVGSLLKNTDRGVFGMFATSPTSPLPSPISVGTRNELRAGKATIYSTLDGTTPKEYTIEISDIKRDATGNKCFTVKITDEELLNKTGGIIQGMSGSPIIQNGKLVGAVTHVLINDPTTGYGIFIENMLSASQAQMPKAA